jgi:hypothetical protein
VQDAAGPELLLAEFFILGVVIGLGLFFGVEMVEVAEEFVEAVVGGQVLVLSPRWFLPNWPLV